MQASGEKGDHLVITQSVTITASESMEHTTETSSTVETQEKCQDEKPTVSTQPKPLAFWLIFVALCLTGLLGALEATVTSTALPTIASVLGSGELFIWVINGYFLTM